ncbi:MAG: N-acetyl-gamma-glutamyl-phosphate reductase [Planctomycetota bacterium]|jgi:N-acetyl-gamma-glutamyl-phosphate reductase
MKRVAILGASGYSGQELARLIAGHSDMQVDLLMSAREGQEPPPPQSSYETAIQPLDLDALQYVDGVFLCTPHGATARFASAALEVGAKVVDLSADFRLRDPQVYAKTYELEHPAPALLEEAVYGLTEQKRNEIKGARLIANPGCYPTAILLPILPLQKAGLLKAGAPIIADCKSGLSGAGKGATATTHFGAVNENFRVYSPGKHRHSAEIDQEAGHGDILFAPHLLPVFRGIYASIYVQPEAGASATDLLACLEETYAAEPFIRLYNLGLPDLQGVQRTNFCDLAAVQCGEQVLLISAIDNLMKGAAGQALQNMNLLLGLEESEGLL